MLILKRFSSPDSTPLISSPLVVLVPFSSSALPSNSLHFLFKLLSKPQNKARGKCLGRCRLPCSVSQCPKGVSRGSCQNLFPSQLSPSPPVGALVLPTLAATQTWPVRGCSPLSGSERASFLLHISCTGSCELTGQNPMSNFCAKSGD